MFEIKVATHFAAAHQLKMIGEKCENLHGHNWKIEVRIKGEALNSAGVLLDFGEVKMHLSSIMEKLDHQFLNELDHFQANSPSSENIACFIAKELQVLINDASIKVASVTAWESENTSATFIC